LLIEPARSMRASVSRLSHGRPMPPSTSLTVASARITGGSFARRSGVGATTRAAADFARFSCPRDIASPLSRTRNIA